MRWLRRRDPAGRVLALPAQTPGARERHGVSRAETDRAAWAFDGAGRRFQGAAAINRALAELPGPWARVAAAYRVPPLRLLEDGVYALVVRSRGHLSSLLRAAPECDDPDIDCGGG